MTILSLSLTNTDATSGQLFTTQIIPAGGTAPYTLTLRPGVLPTGLLFTAPDIIAGIPTTSGDFSWIMTITDSNLPTANVNPNVLALKIKEPPLTETEQGNVLYYLNYPQVHLETQYNLGIPQANQPQYILFRNMANLTDAGLRRVRFLLPQLDNVRKEIDKIQGRMKALKVGKLELQPQELQMRLQLDSTYRNWLAQACGVAQYRATESKMMIR